MAARAVSERDLERGRVGAVVELAGRSLVTPRHDSTPVSRAEVQVVRTETVVGGRVQVDQVWIEVPVSVLDLRGSVRAVGSPAQGIVGITEQSERSRHRLVRGEERR